MRELAVWQEQETRLVREVLVEEEELQGLQARQRTLSEVTDDLERQQACLSFPCAEWCLLLQLCMQGSSVLYYCSYQR